MKVKPKIKKVKTEIQKIQLEFLKTVTSFVVSAFGLVAALAWNKAITELINKYFSPGQSLLSWFLYAILVTILAVTVTVYLGRLQQRITQNKREEK